MAPPSGRYNSSAEEKAEEVVPVQSVAAMDGEEEEEVVPVQSVAAMDEEEEDDVGSYTQSVAPEEQSSSADQGDVAGPSTAASETEEVQQADSPTSPHKQGPTDVDP